MRLEYRLILAANHDEFRARPLRFRTGEDARSYDWLESDCLFYGKTPGQDSTIVDLIRLRPSELQITIENLLNEDYEAVESQSEISGHAVRKTTARIRRSQLVSGTYQHRFRAGRALGTQALCRTGTMERRPDSTPPSLRFTDMEIACGAVD